MRTPESGEMHGSQVSGRGVGVAVDVEAVHKCLFGHAYNHNNSGTEQCMLQGDATDKIAQRTDQCLVNELPLNAQQTTGQDHTTLQKQ
jgi:hypothetical protein